jgi:acyl-CoA synthetase (AMP-forming)/AMP-acid ligase II
MTSQLTDVTSTLARWETERPDAVAIRFGTSVVRTWSELARRVRQNAAAQRAEGLLPGDRVAVLDLNHPSCIELTLACAQVGTANAVVNFRLAPP